MSKNQLVSVIINCHNAQKYLKQSINSVLNQTHKNFEIILWDNNSKDRTQEIIKNFHNKKIKYFFCKKFTNLGSARNQAMKQAKGKYIAFIDSDDIWNKNKLKIQINFLKKKKLRICFTNYYNFYERKKKKEKRIKKTLKKISTQSLLDYYSIGIITVLMERSLLKYKKFDNNLNILEDFDFFIHLSRKVKIGYVNRLLANYRIHNDNFSHKKTIYLTELKNWIKKNEKTFLKDNFNMEKLKTHLIKLKIKKILNFSLI
jgi:teichuronic acid biosynthesis glycosyltransferase TuaG